MLYLTTSADVIQGLRNIPPGFEARRAVHP
jgi:hypothetical protein